MQVMQGYCTEYLGDVFGCEIVVGLSCCMVRGAQWLVWLCNVGVEINHLVCYC